MESMQGMTPDQLAEMGINPEDLQLNQEGQNADVIESPGAGPAMTETDEAALSRQIARETKDTVKEMTELDKPNPYPRIRKVGARVLDAVTPGKFFSRANDTYENAVGPFRIRRKERIWTDFGEAKANFDNPIQWQRRKWEKARLQKRYEKQVQKVVPDAERSDIKAAVGETDSIQRDVGKRARRRLFSPVSSRVAKRAKVIAGSVSERSNISLDYRGRRIRSEAESTPDNVVNLDEYRQQKQNSSETNPSVSVEIPHGEDTDEKLIVDARQRLIGDEPPQVDNRYFKVA